MSLDENRIHLLDCREGLRRLPEGTVDLAFADPPFNIGYDYDVYDDARGRSEYLAWSREWIGGVWWALKPDGTFWLAIGDEYAAELKVLSQEIGFHCRSWVVWYYTFGVNCKQKFSRSHAHLFHFVKDAKRFTFNFSLPEVRVPSARLLVYGDSRGNPDGRLPDDTWILRPQDCVDGFTCDEDTWYFPRVAGTFKERAGFHGCQMPEQLLGRIIRFCSNPGDLVVDPFSGSATTMAVAKKLGRRFLSFDISEDYVQRGTSRLAGIRSGDALEGAPEPTISAPTTAEGRALGALKKTPSKSVSKPAAAKVNSYSAEACRGLIDAYLKCRDGFSVDRVVLDVEMNARFVATCQRLGIPGAAVDWNRTLFRLRKSGCLAGYPTERRTEFDWRDCDQYLDASEIAWNRLTERTGLSLDDIFCAPTLAAEFDHLAKTFAPGFASLQYRWAAMKLRKEAKKIREGVAAVVRVRPSPLRPILDVDPQSFENQAGVYVVAAGKRRPLYVGEAFDLTRRLSRAFWDKSVRQAWEQFAPIGKLCLSVSVSPDRQPSGHDLLAQQAWLAQERQSELNCASIANL